MVAVTEGAAVAATAGELGARFLPHDVGSEEQRSAMVAEIPLGRYQEPVDIANAVLFLASEEARNITGQALVVKGGITLAN